VIESKVISLGDAAARVEAGSILGIGGVMDQMVPISFLLAVADSKVSGLHCVTVAAGLAIDIPVVAGVAAEVSCAIVSFEDLGLSRTFRRRVESGALVFHEHSELTMITRLTAALNGLPYMPTRAALGTNIATADQAVMRVVECPFTGASLLACAALVPDIAVIHVDRADALGNAQVRGKHIWHDSVIARSARSVIVTAEEIVPTEEIRRTPEQTLLPGFVVDAVVLAPGGARPTSCPGRYDADKHALRQWVERTATEEEAAKVITDWVGAGGPVVSR
jgi:glutaconate CoA-transferase subunit A